MNKTITILSLAFSLLGLSTAKADEFIIPASSYSLRSTAGTFTDISNLEGTVPLGADLLAGTALNNSFFVNDATTPFVTHTADASKTDPGFALGFEFNLCGKKMTHFTICASGGIHFSATGNVIQSQSSAWFAYRETQEYTNLVTMAVWDAAGKQNPMISVAGKAPVMYRIDGEAGGKTLTVQYTYALGADEWTFQIKAYEATGNIELVVGDLAKTQVGDKQYNLFFGLVENGKRSSTNDPFNKMNLSNTAHRIAFNQSNAANWDAVSAYSLDPINTSSCMHITATAGPEPGRTLTITAPNTCAEKAAKLPDFYAFSLKTISKTNFTGTLSFDNSAIKSDELMAAGTILIVLSTKEVPDYTLSNGTWYQEGAELNPDGRVLANKKPTFYGEKTLIISPVDFSADGLTEGTRYYLHIYAMDYQCLGAPVYSDLCKTFSFTSSIDLPKSLTTGLPKTTAIPVTVQSAGEGYGVVLLKSPNTNPVNLSGKLEAGQKIGDVEVLTVINSAAETNFDAPFEPGEGAYILAVSATGLDGDNPVYAADFLSEPVRAAYDGLHSFDDFSKEPYTYGGLTNTAACRSVGVAKTPSLTVG